MEATILTLDDLNLDEPDWELVAVVSDNFEDRGDLTTARALRWLRDNQKWPTVFDPFTRRRLNYSYFYVCSKISCICQRRELVIKHHHLPHYFLSLVPNGEIECPAVSSCLEEFIKVHQKHCFLGVVQP